MPGQLLTGRPVELMPVGGIDQSLAGSTRDRGELRRLLWSQNLRGTLVGSLVSRKGQEALLQIVGKNILEIYEYRRADGEHEILAFTTDGRLYAGTGPLDWDEVTTGLDTTSGRMAAVQWRNFLLFGNSKHPLSLYYSNGTDPRVAYAVDLRGRLDDDQDDLLTIATTNNGGYLNDAKYTYRYTLSFYEDGNFVGESAPLNVLAAVDPDTPFWQTDVDFTAQADDDNYVEFKKAATFNLANYGTAKFLNIYRSFADPEPWTNVDKAYTIFYLASIKLEDIDALSTGDAFYTDKGNVPVGRQLDYEPLFPIPRADHFAFYRRRLWFGGCEGWSLEDGAYLPERSRIYASRTDQPFKVSYAAAYEVNSISGGRVNGMTVVGEQAVMLVTEVDRTHVLVSSYDEGELDIPQVQIDPLSTLYGNVGRDIAHTIGGPTWWSHGGPVGFDGNRLTPIAPKRLQALIESIADPSAVRIEHDRLRRETIYLYDSTHALILDHDTGEWWADLYSQQYGAIRAIVPRNAPSFIVLGTIDGNGLVMKANTGYVDGGASPIGVIADFGVTVAGGGATDNQITAAMMEYVADGGLTLYAKADKSTELARAFNAAAALSRRAKMLDRKVQGKYFTIRVEGSSSTAEMALNRLFLYVKPAEGARLDDD